ncbi:Arginine decarboxylase [Trichinella pseudospiralis]
MKKLLTTSASSNSIPRRSIYKIYSFGVLQFYRLIFLAWQQNIKKNFTDLPNFLKRTSLLEINRGKSLVVPSERECNNELL